MTHASTALSSSFLDDGLNGRERYLGAESASAEFKIFGKVEENDDIAKSRFTVSCFQQGLCEGDMGDVYLRTHHSKNSATC